MSEKETVGKLALDLQLGHQDNADAIELQREMTQDYLDNLEKCIHDNKHKYNEPFFVVVLTKREVLLTNVMRNYFFSRETCPTPTFDQAVYRVHPKTLDVEFIWIIPDQFACEYLINNALYVPESERELLEYVIDFRNGTLDKLCMQLNNEFPMQEVNKNIVHID